MHLGFWAYIFIFLPGNIEWYLRFGVFMYGFTFFFFSAYKSAVGFSPLGGSRTTAEHLGLAAVHPETLKRVCRSAAQQCTVNPTRPESAVLCSDPCRASQGIPLHCTQRGSAVEVLLHRYFSY